MGASQAVKTKPASRTNAQAQQTKIHMAYHDDSAHVDRVTRFMKKKGISNRSQAVRSLVYAGLKLPAEQVKIVGPINLNANLNKQAQNKTVNARASSSPAKGQNAKRTTTTRTSTVARSRKRATPQAAPKTMTVGSSVEEGGGPV
jgi:hypothetical protein